MRSKFNYFLEKYFEDRKFSVLFDSFTQNCDEAVYYSNLAHVILQDKGFMAHFLGKDVILTVCSEEAAKATD